MLRSGKVRTVDVLRCLYLFWYRYLEIWQLLYRTILYIHKSQRWQLLSLFFHYRNYYVPKSILPYTLFPIFLPQAYSPLEHSRLTDTILHPLFPKFFSPLRHCLYTEKNFGLSGLSFCLNIFSAHFYAGCLEAKWDKNRSYLKNWWVSPTNWMQSNILTSWSFSPIFQNDPLGLLGWSG